MNKKRTYLIIHLSFSVLLALPPLKDKNIESFMIARYDGDTAMVHSFLSENFTYENAPYVGLGIDAYYVDGSALITHVVDDSIQNQLSVGDRIHELNGAIIDLSFNFTIKSPLLTYSSSSRSDTNSFFCILNVSVFFEIAVPKL